MSQDEVPQPSMHKQRLGRYLGPSDNVGGAMSGMVLTEKGTVLARTSIFPLSADEKQSQEIGKLKGAYAARLADKLKARNSNNRRGSGWTR